MNKDYRLRGAIMLLTAVVLISVIVLCGYADWGALLAVAIYLEFALWLPVTAMVTVRLQLWRFC